jgi:hypothetical protein
MNKECVTGLIGWPAFPIYIHFACHSFVIRHLKQENAARFEGAAAALKNLSQLDHGLAIVNCPGKGTDDVISLHLCYILHPLYANSSIAKALSRHVDHFRSGINAITVDSDGNCSLKKNASAATNVQQSAIGGCDFQRFLDYKAMIMLIVAGRSVEIIPMGKFMKKAVHVALLNRRQSSLQQAL